MTSLPIDLTKTSDEESNHEDSNDEEIIDLTEKRKKKSKRKRRKKSKRRRIKDGGMRSVINLTGDQNDQNGNSKTGPTDGSSSSSSSMTATNKTTPSNDSDDDFYLFHFHTNDKAKPEVDEKEYLKDLLTKYPLKFERFSIVYVHVLSGYYVVCNIYVSEIGWTERDEVWDDEINNYKERKRRYESKYVFTGFRIDKDDNKIKNLERLRTFMKEETSQSDNLIYDYTDNEGNDTQENITELNLEFYSEPIIPGSSWLSRFNKDDKEIVIQQIEQEIKKQRNTSSNLKKVEQLTLIKLKF